MAAITLQDVRVVRDGRLVLAVDHLDVRDGELLVVVGPSGSGKTTLLRSIAGLDEVTSGAVLFDATDITNVDTAERGVAMVFQDSTLFPFMNVRRNIAFPLEVRRTDKEEVDSRVEAEARVLAIEHLLARQPKQLGAGHQQLVQAARALVRVPEVFLMDEPLARLDAQLRLEMRQEFRLLQDGYKVTMIFVTNDQEEAMVMADRVVVLCEGHVRQIGSPMDLYREPASKFVAQFIGSPPMSFLSGRLELDPPGFWVSFGGFRLRAWAPALTGAGERVEVGVRAEDVVEDPDGLPVEVGRGHFLGDHGFARVQLAPDDWVQMRTTGQPPPPGSTISVNLRQVHLFDPVTDRALGRIENQMT